MLLALSVQSPTRFPKLRYWLSRYRGLGVKPALEVRYGVYRGSPYANYPTYHATRAISQFTYEAERMIRRGGGNNFRWVRLFRRAASTAVRRMRKGLAIQEVVDSKLTNSGDPILADQVIQRQAFGTNARGNTIFPDWRIALDSQTVIDLTTTGQAGKILQYQGGNLIEPYTGTTRIPLGLVQPPPLPRSGTNDDKSEN